MPLSVDELPIDGFFLTWFLSAQPCYCIDSVCVCVFILGMGGAGFSIFVVFLLFMFLFCEALCIPFLMYEKLYKKV